MQRRQFILGAGGLFFGLPWLESFQGKGLYAAEAPDTFAIFIRQPHGVVQPQFWPTELGALTEKTLPNTQALSVLSAHASQLLVVRGVSHPFPNVGCDHAYGGIQALTAAKPIPNKDANRTRPGGESLDNRIARELSPGKEPLTLYAGRRGGFLDDFLSFRGPGDLRAAERSPFLAYRRIFALNEGASTSRTLLRKSVNDLVREQLLALRADPRLSKADGERLDLHLQSIRDVEVNIAMKLPDEKIGEMESKSNEKTYTESLPDIVKLHMDVIGLAIASGQTRSATLQIGSGIDGTMYTLDGKKFPSSHAISHRDTGPDSVLMHARLDVLHAELFKYMLDTLQQYKFGEKNLLDFGCAVVTSEIADGPSHSHKNVPYIIAGSCGGKLKQGQYIDAKGDTNNRLLNGIGAAVGLVNERKEPLDDFGDSGLKKGIVEGMMA